LKHTFTHVKHSLPDLVREQVNDDRLYVAPNGLKYPSVTTVISQHNKEAVDKWKASVGETAAKRISKKATDRGTAVHKAIETLLNNEDTSSLGLMPDAKSVYVNMKKELIERLSEVHALEQPLYSHNLRMAGTTDCVAVYDDKLSIVDFKTSTKLKKKEWMRGYFMQGVAYSEMWEELTNSKIEQVVILIGVDNCNFAQTFRLPKNDFGQYLDELLMWRDKYEAINGDGDGLLFS
jgi:genome maintenance exonuclease 1